MSTKNAILLYSIIFIASICVFTISIVKASPLCTVNDDVNITGTLDVGGKTNIIVAVNPWQVTDCSAWDDIPDGTGCDFAVDTNYSAVMLAAVPDLTSDNVVIGFYDGAGGTGNKIGQIRLANSYCSDGLSSWWWQTPSTVILPTVVKSAKIESAGGCRGAEVFSDNITIMAYFR